ncbi:hypothetical protein RclHR1_04990005 [Rhizophagus clarus]|uniref:Uncharacterized protein n=1 Tax=Rhizophagus clarus TaxID=94130 RepID=A0A2Z6S307_9GLOM|nr:hypothetical protein RclHR1_04990005 [Rhizophagus clarus]
MEGPQHKWDEYAECSWFSPTKLNVSFGYHLLISYKAIHKDQSTKAVLKALYLITYFQETVQQIRREYGLNP